MSGSIPLARSSLAMRPAHAADEGFLLRLYRSARPDLALLPLPPAELDALVAQQYQAMLQGAGQMFAGAQHYVIERQGDAVGALIVEIGSSELRIVYLAMIPAVRGQGVGAELLHGLQQAARQVRAPLVATVWQANTRARSLYLRLGFRVEATQPGVERLAWYPEARPTVQMP